MRVTVYQDIINETAIYPFDIGMAYCALGLTGEAGEVADKVKKLYRDLGYEDSAFPLRDDYPEEAKALAKELGDTLWYLTALAQRLGYTLEEIMEMNYEKLMARRATGTLQGSGDDREQG